MLCLRPPVLTTRSRDGGKSWRAHGQLQNQRTWLIENTLVERSDGAVLMLFRTKVGVLWKSVSYDKGVTWAEAVPTSIPNPDSKIHMLRLLSGHLALVRLQPLTDTYPWTRNPSPQSPNLNPKP